MNTANIDGVLTSNDLLHRLIVKHKREGEMNPMIGKNAGVLQSPPGESAPVDHDTQLGCDRSPIPDN